MQKIAKLKIFRDILMSWLSIFSYTLIFLMYVNIQLNYAGLLGLLFLFSVLAVLDYYYIFPVQQQIIYKKMTTKEAK
jgi:hypothetical protein